MSATKAPVLISLDPPYRIDEAADSHVFLGWAEVDDPATAQIRLSISGVDVPVTTFESPTFQTHFPGVQALSFYAQVTFQPLLAQLPPSAFDQPFLLRAKVTSGARERTFEYAVTDKWLERMLGRPAKARPSPPEHLQIRVTGAAAGGFYAAGAVVAGQIAEILERAGRPLQSFQHILDFGCGPGRVISFVHERNPGAALSGSDIDAEAIAWAQANLGDIADFRVNGAEAPLPFSDEAFDLIYSISIFTHLPEDMQWPMLSELRRILKPGGVLLTTKLDPTAYALPPHVVSQAQAAGFAYYGEARETDGLPSFYRLAYHTRSYVEREWGRYFEVLHVGSHDLNNTQDAVLLRRPRHLRSRLPSPLRKALHRLTHPR